MVPLTTKKENPLFFLPQSSQQIKIQRGRRVVRYGVGRRRTTREFVFLPFLIFKTKSETKRKKEKRKKEKARERDRQRRRKTKRTRLKKKRRGRGEKVGDKG